MTRTTVKVYLEDENGNTDSYITPINLVEQEAHDYFLNKWWNMGTEDDHMMKCNRVETLQIEQDGRIIMPSYKQKFAKWREKYKGEISDKLHEVVETELTFKVGDRVRYTNAYGVVFEPHEVLGFCKLTSWGACVYLDLDCYWCPVKLSSIKPYIKND